MIGLIPDGVVVFLPSYAFLDKLKAFWAKSGLMSKLADRKEVSFCGSRVLHQLMIRSSTNPRPPETSRPSYATMH